MKRQILLSTSIVLFVGAAAASADCREDLAQLGGGVSKDGTMAPLETSPAEATPQTGAAAADPAPAAEGEGIVQDGSTEPMEADPNLATSAQDAQAQQEGGDTAAAEATDPAAGTETSARSEALARAQAALDAGDEAGCLAAVAEAKG